MRNTRFMAALVVAGVAILLIAPLSSAQMTVERAKAIDAQLQQIKAAYDKLPPSHQQAVDSIQNVVQLADVWHKHGLELANAAISGKLGLPGKSPDGGVLAGPPAAGLFASPVNDPSTDLAFSAFAGYTQSETSTARCGNSVVVGFNDSNSVFETGFLTGGGLSFSGAAASSDGGATFTDIGPIPPGPAPNFVVGDPKVNCTNSSTFYYSQVFFNADSLGNPLASIALSKSTDGGHTWGDPVAAVSKDGFTHLLDKSWSTIDPKRTNLIYVSYTDFDFSGTSSACPNNFRVAIEVVGSNNGGATFSKPHVIIQVCGNAAVQGSQLAVDSHGVLHVAWVNLGDNFPFPPRSLQTRSVLVNGSLTPIVTASSITPGGDDFFLQGVFRDFIGMTMAVDRSGTATDGTCYVTWDDGRDKSVPDIFTLTGSGTYNYDDVMAISAPDCATWTAPVKVNSDVQPADATHDGHDHWQPGIAVDKTGKVAICWYDRRDDVENFSVEHFCAASTNGGISWTDSNTGVAAFAPTHGEDQLVNGVYMGDYDELTTDFTGANAGFIGAFQVMGLRGNPDVVAIAFR